MPRGKRKAEEVTAEEEADDAESHCEAAAKHCYCGVTTGVPYGTREVACATCGRECHLQCVDMVLGLATMKTCDFVCPDCAPSEVWGHLRTHRAEGFFAPPDAITLWPDEWLPTVELGTRAHPFTVRAGRDAVLRWFGDPLRGRGPAAKRVRFDQSLGGRPGFAIRTFAYDAGVRQLTVLGTQGEERSTAVISADEAQALPRLQRLAGFHGVAFTGMPADPATAAQQEKVRALLRREIAKGLQLRRCPASRKPALAALVVRRDR